MENFVKIECFNCGVLFAVSNSFRSNLQESKKQFFCPNGHPQAYIKSRADILQEKLNARVSEEIRKDGQIATLER